MAFSNVFAAKTVWCSGTTGFKGAWLAHWLTGLGAKVRGFALPPGTRPSLFEQSGLAQRIDQEYGDVREAARVARSMREAAPDFVFHLAAQSLVRPSYLEPAETYATNLLGTVHVLEALRLLKKPCAAIIVTTDKCYENREWLHGYREEDPLGGHDPYSSSKACAEIAVASWRRSFFGGHPVRIASVRAGNVVGGGDWAADRIVPDCIRALQMNQPIAVRNPAATRPWQHVLEPLSGYLWLAAVLSRPELRPGPPQVFPSAFNFGPGLDSNRTVGDLVREILRHWPGSWVDASDPQAVHEAGRLNLAIDKAFHLLGWQPVWNFSETVAATVDWYRQCPPGTDPAAAARLLAEQIGEYTRRATLAGRDWASGAAT